MTKQHFLPIAGAAFAVLALCTAAQAQTTPPAGRTRAEVQAEAVAAAHAPDQNVVRGSRGMEPFQPMADQQKMQDQAVAAAHAPDQNVVRGSRGMEPFQPMADSQKVQDQAVAAAHAPDQNVISGSRVNSQVISTMNAPQDSAQASQGNGASAR